MEVSAFIASAGIHIHDHIIFRGLNSVNTQCCTHIFEGTEIKAGTLGIQAILLQNAIQRIFHFLGVKIVSVICIRELRNLVVVDKFRINTVIRIVFLFEFIPLHGCLVCWSTLQACQSKHLLLNRLRTDNGDTVIANDQFIPARICNPEILHFKSINDGAAHHKYHRGNDGCDQPHSFCGMMVICLFLRLTGRIHFFYELVVHTANSMKHSLFFHSAIPSCSRKDLSFPRVLKSDTFTLLSLIP